MLRIITGTIVSVICLSAATAQAASGGITGYSGSPSSSGTCSSCHTGTTFDYNGVISVNGDSTSPEVEENSAYGVTFALTRSSGSSASHVGFNMSATGGTLSESSSVLQSSGGELTHMSPRPTSGGNYTFSSMSWTAPSAGASGNTYTLYACGNLVVYDGDTTNDGPPACDSVSVTVYETPTVGSWSTSSASYTEGTPVTLDSFVTITDTDSSNMNRAELSVTNAQSGDQLLCPSSPPSGINCAGDGTSSLVLYGTSSKSNYETAIESVQFDNSSDDPSTVTRTIDLRVRDSGNHYSAYSYKSLSVTPVNDAPVVSGVNSALAYTEGDGAASLDTVISVSDPENDNLNLATVEIYSGYDGTEDSLGWSSALCSTYSLSCSFSAGTFTVSGTGTLAEYGNVLESVTYTNSSEDPNTANRYVRYRLRDTGSAYSGYDYQTISVSAVNDAPVTSGIGATLAYTENDPASAVDAALGISDVDSTQLNLAQVSISANYNAGEDSLSANASLCSSYGLSCSFSSGTLTISGTALLSEYEAVLESVSYANSSDAPSTSTRTIRYRVRDTASGYSSYDYAYVTVSAVNDAPQITSTPSTTGTEGVQYSYTVAVSDPDDSGYGSGLTLALNTAEDNNGAALSGVSFNTSTGQLTWTPPNGLAGPAHFEVQVSDGGEDGSTADVQSWTVSVDAVNDPPVITSTAPTSATEDQQYQYPVQVSDPDDNNDGSGDLTFSLSNEPAGMTVSNTGLVTWTPTEGVTSSGTVTVQVADGGENGATPDTESFSITVTAVNDAPVIDSPAVTTATEDTQYVYDVSVSDPDDANNGTDLTWQLTSAPSGMNISTTGQITWTPGEGVTSSGTVTVRVADGGEDGATADSQSFTISVTPVNDPVTITSTAGTSATEDQQYQYQVQVSDPDDSNNGTDIHFTLVSAPAGMSVGATGLITWTPPNGVSSANVDLRVADGLEDGAVAATESWTINVTAVNDPPVIQQAADTSVEEKSAFSLQLVEQDVDDANNGTDLSWSAITMPSGMTLSGTGLLEWTPGEGTAGSGASQDYTIRVQLADGGEDGSTPDQMTFTLTVTKLDTDSDTVADYNDNCPATANTDQANNDGDSEGDACDDDDDNDGIEDSAELANGLDPFDSSDASGDLDGDGLSNLQEFQTCASNGDSTCNAISTDSVAPVISVQDLRVPSTGYFTAVELQASAEDGIDGVVDVVPDEEGPFRPGRHSITWTATDRQGNTAQATQILDVLPQVSLGGGVAVTEGSAVTVPVRLNGEAPGYPVTVQLALGGDADGGDHDLSAPVAVTFNSGTEASVAFNVLADGLAEGDETLRLGLDGISGDAVASDADHHDVLIVERQLPPDIAMTVSQGAVDGTEVYQGQGPVTVRSNASDANGDAPLVHDWSSALSLNLAGDEVSFDPDAVTPGTYSVSVEVSDPYVTVSDQISIRVRAAAELPVLGSGDTDGDGIDDATEGRGDSDGDGIPDYRDAIDSDSTQVVEQGESGELQDALLMQVEQGLSLRLGERALAAGNDRATVASGQVGTGGSAVEDPGYTHLGLIYDFQVRGLSEAGRSARVVVPLHHALVPGAVWRKFANGSWRGFVVNGSDSLHSSARVNGACPAPLSGDWRPGLNPGDGCVRLTLTDGGDNDADGEINGVIVDPGGAAVRTEPAADPSVPGGTANSGGIGVRMLWLLVLLGLFRQRRFSR